MNIDSLVDAFVEKFNAGPREPLSSDESAPSVRLGKPNECDFLWDWRILRSDQIDWIENLESKLPARFPPSFRSLVTRYIFPPFEIRHLVTLCGNTPDKIKSRQLRRWATDRELWGRLLDSGYIPFAYPEMPNFDPICFDANHKDGDGEYRVVRFFHEAVWLSYRKLRIEEVVADSFRAVLEESLETS